MKRVLLSILSLVWVAACGSEGGASATSDPIPTVAPTASTAELPTTTEAQSTTTAPSTTTTEAMSSERVWAVFSDYFAALVARDWEAARSLATGPARDFADFSEALDIAGGREPWEVTSESDPTELELIVLEDRRYGVDGVIELLQPTGPFNASAPVILQDGSDLWVENWGVDFAGDGGAPSLAARIQKLPIGPGCLTDSSMAYLSSQIVDNASNLLVAYQVCLIDGVAVVPDLPRSYLDLPDGRTIPAFGASQQPADGTSENQLTWLIVGYTVPMDSYAGGGVSRLEVTYADGQVTQLTGHIPPFAEP